MTPSRRPSSPRRPARGGARASTGQGSSGRGSTGGGARAAGRGPGGIAPPPIEARDARGIAAGLLLFAAGMAVGGVLVAARLGGGPLWSIAIALGFLGIGAVGVFQRRTLSPVPRPAMWSPRYLGEVAAPLGVPVAAFLAVFYGLLAIGVAGNLLVPLVRR